MGWRFFCCVLGMVLTSGAAFAQAPEIEAEEPATTAEPAPISANEAAASDSHSEAVQDGDVEVEQAEMTAEPAPRAPTPPAPTGLEFQLRADQPGLLRFVAPGASEQFRAPGRATLQSMNYEVTWVPSDGTPELLEAQWRPNGEAVRVAHRGPSFTNLLGYWLFGNGLLVGLPVSVGVFAKRDDLGAAATFSIIGVNTLVAIAGAILMGMGDDEVIELE